MNKISETISKIEENKNEKRPYVGVVLQIGSIEYYAPLRHQSQNIRTWKTAKTSGKLKMESTER